MARYWCTQCSQSVQAGPAHPLVAGVGSLGCGLLAGFVAFAGMVTGYALRVSSNIPAMAVALFALGGLLIGATVRVARYHASVRAAPVCRSCGTRFEAPTVAPMPWTAGISPTPLEVSGAEVRSSTARGGLTCPKCHSDQVLIGRRGYNWKKGGTVTGAALVTMPLLGVLSLAGMAAGAHGRTRVRLQCLECGKQWEPGKR